MQLNFVVASDIVHKPRSRFPVATCSTSCTVALMAGHKQRAPLSELMNNTQQDLDDFQAGTPPAKKATASDRFADPKS